MDFQKLLYSILFLIASVLAYKYEKWSVKKKKEKWGVYYKRELYPMVQGWGIILICIFLSLLYFFEAIKSKN
jgi:hypothetical protein